MHAVTARVRKMEDLSASSSSKTVLVCFRDRRRPVTFSSGNKETSSLICAFQETFADVLGEEKDSTPLLQMKNEDWGGEFVDIQGDTVPDRAVVKALLASKHDDDAMTSKAQALCAKVGKPSEGVASKLREMFPSSGVTVPRKRPSLVFDPLSECVVEAQKRKKKSANQRMKPRNVTVVVLEKYASRVPQRAARKKLNNADRIKKVELRRNMSVPQVKATIIHAFEHLPNISKYTLLVANQSGFLALAPHQALDGNSIIEQVGQGSLYICQEYVDPKQDVQSDKRSSVEPGASKTPDLGCEVEVISVPSDSESVLDLSPRATGAQSVEETSTGMLERTPSHDMSQLRQQQLEEDRMIRAEQDRAFEDNLRIDRAKEEEVKRCTERRERLEKLHTELKESFKDVPCGDVIHLAFRRPDGSKAEADFHCSAPTQVLYEYAFSSGTEPIGEPFGIFQIIPRREIPLSKTLSLHEAGLTSTQLLVVEFCVDAADPLEFLGNPQRVCEDILFQVKQSTVQAVDIVVRADRDRGEFMDSLALFPGVQHFIHRHRIFEDVIDLYRNGQPLTEYPLSIKFHGERAYDAGGVTRDMFSAFWEAAYERVFDGSTLLAPVMHPQVDFTILPLLGAILSHGFLLSGFLPLRVAFPVLGSLLLGPCATTPPQLLMEAFIDSISEHDNQQLRSALSAKEFTAQTTTELLAILSRFGCREMPTPSNLKQQLLQLAKYEFVTKPYAAICCINQGIPASHHPFWASLSIGDLWQLYLALGATPSKVIELIDEPECLTSNQSRIFGYLIQMVGSMKQEELRALLRFITGSSVCLSRRISVSFNSLSGLARRPIAHTCDCILELPVSYMTYPEFVSEIKTCFSAEECWYMDAI